MAYITCPWCLAPQQVGDDVISYQCFSCYSEIGFFACPSCGTPQSVSKRTPAFLCGNCEEKVDLPHRWSYSNSAKAFQVRGAGKSWPPM